MCSKKIFITILSLFIMILAISCGKVPYNPFNEVEGKYYVTKEADTSSGSPTYTWIVFKNARLFQQYSASKTEKPTFTFSSDEDTDFTFTASDDTTFVGKYDTTEFGDITLTLKFSSDRTTVSYSLVAVFRGEEQKLEEVYNLVN